MSVGRESASRAPRARRVTSTASSVGLDPPGPHHGRGAHAPGAGPQHQAGGMLDVVDTPEAQVQRRAPDPQEPPHPGQELALGRIPAVDVDVEHAPSVAGR